MAIYDKETIIRYVEGELSDEERQLFEAALERDTGLAREVTLYKNLRETLIRRLPQDEGEEALAGTLRELRPRYFGSDAGSRGGAAPPLQAGNASPARGRVVPLSRYLAASAAVAAVVAAVLIFWPSRNIDIAALGNIQMIGSAERGAGGDSALDKAGAFFNSGQFEKALPYLDSAVHADTASQLALFYRGVAEWHTHDLSSARTDLSTVFGKGSVLRYEAAFYMAFTYATNGDKQQAINWLQKIPPDASVSGKADSLRQFLTRRFQK